MYRRAVLPIQHIRAESVVGEALGWVEESILGELEMDKKGLGGVSVLQG